MIRVLSKFIPKIKQTEKIALTAGTIGLDRKIFQSNVFNNLSKYNIPQFTEEEHNYINNTVKKEVIPKINDLDLMLKKGFTKDEVYENFGKYGLFGINIPKEHDGLDFSQHAHSQIVQLISTVSSTAGVTVMVPNSLGPAELLLHYGTDDQKEKYLSKLARGQLIPCFGLTGPLNGSDAASNDNLDRGVIYKDESTNEIRIRFSCNKRWITLAPISDLVGIAINVEDPDKLLNTGSEGITLLLLEREKYQQELVMGEKIRHYPAYGVFHNGPIQCADLDVSLNEVVGGPKMVGQGWKMLMECLSAGRGISLPASAVGNAKMLTLSSLAYSNVRSQFNIPLIKMEAIQDKLADMICNTFIINSSQKLMNSILDNKESPSVLTAVQKYRTTYRSHSITLDSMEIFAGKGITVSKDNIPLNSYVQAPIGITVEGANILSRNLIVYGQGLMRSHPNLFNLVEAIQENKSGQVYNNIVQIVFDYNKYLVKNIFNYINPNISRNNLKKHKKIVQELNDKFALFAQSSLLMGGKIKTNQMMSGRYADVFSALFESYSVLWFADHNDDFANSKTFELCMISLENEINSNLIKIQQNMPVLGLKQLLYPLRSSFKVVPVADKLKKDVVKELGDSECKLRDILKENIHFDKFADLLEAENQMDLNSVIGQQQVDSFDFTQDNFGIDSIHDKHFNGYLKEFFDLEGTKVVRNDNLL